MGDEGAPPVVAVVVACDPGPWLEDCLRSLDAQDYPNCSVLVIDNASAEPIAGRVAAVAPNLYLHRLGERCGYARAANVVAELVENAAFYLFCHDDVVLAPDALSRLVAEAFRSNAGIVGPKLLDAEEPSRLLQLGLGVDRLGTPVGRVERGELDQAQHDEVREVFAVPGGCGLVRADLFGALGGFDPEISLFGEDVDFCWRARLAGARAVVEPAASVLHLEALASRLRPCPEARELRKRHELRVVLKNYAGVRRLVAAGQMALLSVFEIAYFFLLGQRDRARELTAAWRWNLADDQGLKRARAEVDAIRRVPDRIVARLFSHRRSRTWRIVRRHLPERLQLGESWATAPVRPRRAAAGHDGVGRSGPSAALARSAAVAGSRYRSARERVQHHAHHERRAAWVGPVALAAALVLVVGARSVLFGPLPLVGQLLPIASPSSLLGHYFGGFNDAGMQNPGPASPALLVLGLAGGLLTNDTSLLLHLELLLAVVAGGFGVARLLRGLAPPSARLIGALAYLFVPLAWNDLASGGLNALIAYGGMPFVLARIARATHAAPFDDGALARQPAWREVLSLGAVLGLLGAFAPATVVVSLVAAVALGLGGLLAGSARAAGRGVAVAFGGVAVAFVLCLPWSLTYLQPGAWFSALVGAHSAMGRVAPLSVLLRFALGPMGHGLLGWAVLAAAGVALVLGRGDRLAWAARYWVGALGTLAFAWALDEGWLGAGGDLGLFLAPAACALAACVGLGAASVVVDLPRARFGWRHLVALAGGACAVAGLLPVFAAAPSGRFGLPSSGYDSVLSWTSHLPNAASRPAAARVLWLGDPAALPLPGWQLRPGLALGVSEGGLPDNTRLWRSANPGAARQVIADVAQAESGQTVRLGHLLVAESIAAIVVPTATAPVLGTLQQAAPAPPPEALLAGLAAQGDLHALPSEGGALVYENAAWRPGPVPRLPGGGTPAPLRSLGVAAELVLIAGAAIALGSRRLGRRASHRAATAAGVFDLDEPGRNGAMAPTRAPGRAHALVAEGPSAADALGTGEP
ncbi:MAG: glycosyltransferase family 2 protein [Actinomycetota bacterium]|nr:glycosyltransferase family 2 protein [Actinomycetota bacterium]